MHILINKLGGCRGAEAEGDVMAWFVALFATAADEDWLMERFNWRWVEVFRLYSLGTDGLSNADNGVRAVAALDRAGFAFIRSLDRRVDLRLYINPFPDLGRRSSRSIFNRSSLPWACTFPRTRAGAVSTLWVACMPVATASSSISSMSPMSSSC